jgi:pyruvate formate lyase activating enzyme
MGTHEAMLWQEAGEKTVDCHLCAHRCHIKPGQAGICRVRENVDGKLMTLTYDQLISMNVDPIEKKPLFHVLPGSTSMSIATPGCNFRCDFCQNWQISQSPRDGRSLASHTRAVPPQEIVDAAASHGCRSISYTYTEPTIFFELAYDTARLANEAGMKNCFVSNGYMTPEAVEKISPYLEAINVDLKAFRDETYRKVMGGQLEPVLDALRALRAAGIWIEVTTLVVPGMNESEEELHDIASFIHDELAPTVPWHVSRFHGDYRMRDSLPTPAEAVTHAVKIGMDVGLKHVYSGNMPGRADESTYCPNCEARVIHRQGFFVVENRLEGGACPECNQAVAGLWK